jgi:probable rRNA maturation factor
MSRAVSIALRNERFALSGTFCFIFVDKKFLKELNRQFRSVRRETDVISFSYLHDKTLRFDAPDVPLADIYISEDNALENAKRFGETSKNEFLRLVIHGTLHALGYTDYEPRAKKKMWSRQEKALLQTLR